jgi:hypothetical protein
MKKGKPAAIAASFPGSNALFTGAIGSFQYRSLFLFLN